MEFVSEDYLPNSAERIEHLRQIINGRTVAILASGTSIQGLEERIYELTDTDICYFGLNSFILQEANILDQIGKRMSIVMCSARGISEIISEVIDFLDRDEDNMFVSSFYDNTFKNMGSEFDLARFTKKYDSKLLFFYLNSSRSVPSSDLPLHFMVSNSLLVLIQLAIIGKASRIFLFGADGGYKKKGSKEWYYRQDDTGYRASVGNKWNIPKRELLIEDTNKRFNPVAPIAIRNTLQTYGRSFIELLNCSVKSLYTPFPLVTYDDALNSLIKESRTGFERDFRVPKVSVITVSLDASDQLVETIENISSQSYSNHEHLIIYNGSDLGVHDMMRKFPFVRWIRGKNISNVLALKRGISEGRGDYIFFCRNGEGFLDEDWINTCVEVLENDIEISLVWGLSKSRLEKHKHKRYPNAYYHDDHPPHKYKYIHYWLKRKKLFPEEAICVRKKVLNECLPMHDSEENHEIRAWINFNFRFNTLGFLPHFVPVVASYAGKYANWEEKGLDTDASVKKLMKSYYSDIKNYNRMVGGGKTVHHFRNGLGQILSNSPDIIGNSSILNLFEKYWKIWGKYQCSVFRMAISKILLRFNKRGVT